MFLSIKSQLSTSSKIVALVNNRIYPDQVPLDEPEPALSLFLVSTVYDDLLDGTPLITVSNWQINCLASSRMTASQLADAVFETLHCQQFNAIKFARVINRNDELPDTGVSLRRTIIELELKHHIY